MSEATNPRTDDEQIVAVTDLYGSPLVLTSHGRAFSPETKIVSITADGFGGEICCRETVRWNELPEIPLRRSGQ